MYRMYVQYMAHCSASQEERLFNFKALGRFIGLCLWFKQTVPLMISRHVAKYLLGRCVLLSLFLACVVCVFVCGVCLFALIVRFKFNFCRELTWHDLAFFNSDLYEGLRMMLLDAEKGIMSKEDFMAAYCCYFEVSVHGIGICRRICANVGISICGAIG